MNFLDKFIVIINLYWKLWEPKGQKQCFLLTNKNGIWYNKTYEVFYKRGWIKCGCFYKLWVGFQ